MRLLLEFSNLPQTWLFPVNDIFQAIADKSTVAKVLEAQVKDDYFGDVVKRIILNNVMNRLHGDEIELLNSNSVKSDTIWFDSFDYTEFFALSTIFREKFIQNLPQNAKFDQHFDSNHDN